MAPHDPDDPSPTGERPADSERKPNDLRFSSTEQSGVRISRDLSGQGHLARGSSTNMSSMRFSVRAQPRQELDPELQALRPSSELPESSVSAASSLSPASTAPEALRAEAASPSTAPAAATLPATSPAEDRPASGGVLDAIKRLFS